MRRVDWVLYVTDRGDAHAVLKCDPNEDDDNDEPDYVGLGTSGPMFDEISARMYDSFEALLEAPELTPAYITKLVLAFL